MGLELLEREIRTNLTADGSVYESVLRDGERTALRFKQNVGGSFQGLARDTNAFSAATRNGAGHMLKYISTGAALSGALSQVGVSTGLASKGVSLVSTALSGALGPIGWVVAALAGLGFTIKQITDDQKGLREETEKATQALINQASKSGARTVGEGEDLSKRYREDITKRGEYEREIKRLEGERRNLGFFDQFQFEPITRELGKWRGLLTGVNTELDLMNDALEKAGMGARQHPMDIGLKPIEVTGKRFEKPEQRRLAPWEISENSVYTYSQPGQQLPGTANMTRGFGRDTHLPDRMVTDEEQKPLGYPDEHFERIKQAQMDEIERLQMIQQVGSAAYRGIAVEAQKATKIEQLGRIQVGKLILQGYRDGAAAFLEAEGQKAAMRGSYEAIEAIAAFARHDISAGIGHTIASGEFMGLAGLYAVGASITRGGGGSGSSAASTSGAMEDTSSSGGSSGPTSKLLTSSGVETNNWYLNITYQGPVFYDRGLQQLAEDLLGYVRDMHEGGRLGREPAR